MDITDFPAHDHLAVRLAQDARSHAIRTGTAFVRSDDCICTRRGKVITANWYMYGLLLLRQRILVRTRVSGIIRFLPPPPSPESSHTGNELRKKKVSYRHAAHRQKG